MRLFTRSARPLTEVKPYVNPEPAEVELTAELIERVRAHLAREHALDLMQHAPSTVWSTEEVLDYFIGEVVR